MGATVENTYGALLLGAFVACCFSGIVTVQSFLYIKLYPRDVTRTKVIVAAVWLLDTIHTCFVMASVWNYLIPHFGDVERYDFIPWSVAMTIAVTAVLTFIVHCFLAWRIHKLTQNAWITSPIFILAVLRLTAACVTTAEMIRTQSFTEFSKHFRWVFTVGLALSSTVDVLITVVLCIKLWSSRTGSINTDFVIDSLVRYTFENGSLTCAATVLSMICWLTMSYNRIFLGLHFMIGKLYANSLLATLNTRKQLRQGRTQITTSGEHILPVMFPDMFPDGFSGGSRRGRGRFPFNHGPEISERPGELQINVQKTVESRLDEEDFPTPGSAKTETCKGDD
jgi:hypothetical protein